MLNTQLNLKNLVFFFFCMLYFIPIYSQSGSQLKREENRLEYEIRTIKSYSELEFSDIPWRVIFNDAQLSFRAVENFFLNKVEGIDLFQYDRKLGIRWELYRRSKSSEQGKDDTFMFSDERIESIHEYNKKRISQGKNFGPSNFQFIGQTTTNLVNQGFANTSGRIERVNFHPTDTTIVWASAPEGGLWKSTDCGDTWTIVDDYWDHLSVGDLVYNTHDHDTIFVATDDHDSWFNDNRGILRSDDGGLSWTVVGLPNATAQRVNKLGLQPDGRSLYVCTNQGLFNSSDHGVTWIRNNAINGDVNDLEYHPVNSNIIYLTTRGGASPNFGYFYVSTDGGATFVQQVAPLDSKGRTAQVCVSQHNPNIAYIGVYPEPPTYTVNGGMVMKYTHTTGSIVIQVEPAYTFPGAVGGAWDFRIEVNPMDSNHLIYGCVGLYESIDGGVNWTQINQLHADIHDIKWQANTNKLWVADDGGLGYTIDNAASWTSMYGLPVIQLYDIASSRYGSHIALGTQDNHTLLNYNGNWFNWNMGDGTVVLTDPVDSTIIYGSQNTGGWIKRATYMPATNSFSDEIIFLTSNYIGGALGEWRIPFEMHTENRNILYVCYKDIWKTTDRGATWSNMTNGNIGNGQNNLAFFYQSKSNSNILLTGWGRTDLRKSTDGGMNWSAVPYPSVALFDVPNLVISPTDPDMMWVCGASTVERTINGGQTWTDFSGTLPAGIGLSSIKYQEGSNEGLYVGGDLGNVFYRDSTMTDWVLFNNNLPKVRLNDIEVSATDGTIRVATWGRGIWESPLYAPSSTICAEPAPPQIQFGTCTSSNSLTISAAPNNYNIAWYRGDTMLMGETGTSLNLTTPGTYTSRYLDGSCNSYFSDYFSFRQFPSTHNRGLNLDGIDDHVRIAHSSSLNLGDNFTFEFWTKFTTAAVGTKFLLRKTGAYGIDILNGNDIRFVTWGDDITFIGGFLNDSLWHHYALVAIGGTEKKLYRDGVLIETNASAYTTDQSSSPLYLGFTSDPLAFSIDELKIWSQSRTQAQIIDGMFCQISCPPIDLVLYMPFEDGVENADNSGLQEIYDFSYNNNYGIPDSFALNGTASNFTPAIITGMIIGETVACRNQNIVYSVPQFTGATSYTWNLPNGWIGSSDSNSIHLTSGIFGGSISVDVALPCGEYSLNTSANLQNCSSSLDLDGSDDYVQIPDNSSLDLGNDFTIEFWANATQNSGHRFLLRKEVAYGIDISDDDLLFVTWGDDVWFFDQFLLDGQWHHYALTASGGNEKKLYRDNQLVGIDNSVYVTDQSNNPLHIGFSSSTLGFTIDELRIWNATRDSSEIAQNIYCGISGTEANLVLYYDFEDGVPLSDNNAVTQVNDKSTFNNHGTLNNFTLNGSASNFLFATTAGNDSDGDNVSDDCDICQGNDASGDIDNDGLCNDIDQECDENTMTINGNPVDEDTFHALIDLLSAGNIINGRTVIFKAENSIQLLPEFEVEVGAIFQALIENCPEFFRGNSFYKK